MTAFLLNPTVAVLFYGTVLLVVWGMCELSGQSALKRCAHWLAIAWVGSNLIFAWLHAGHAPWLSPAFNALICVAIAGVAIRERSTRAWWIVGVFCFEFAFIVASFLVHRQGSIPYYVTLNLCFLGRMAVLGEAGGVELVDRVRRGSLLVARRPVGLARRREG